MPYGPFGAKPAGVSVFIGVSILLNADARQGFGVHQYRYTNERRSPGGLRPKRPVGHFGSFFLITNCCQGYAFPCTHIGKVTYQEQASKGTCGPFGTIPAIASAFIGVSILLNSDAFAGIVQKCPPGHFDNFFPRISYIFP